MSPLSESLVSPRTLFVCFLVDVSESMSCYMNFINDFIRCELSFLREYPYSWDFEIELSILTFSAESKWVYPTPKVISAFDLTDIETDGNLDSYYSYVCKELSTKLSRKAFLRESGSYYPPVIILLSDGEHADNYYDELCSLKNNKWFKHAYKAAIDFGADSDVDVLAEMVEDQNSVFHFKSFTGPNELAQHLFYNFGHYYKIL